MRNLLLFLIIILTASLGFYACGPKEEYHNVPTQYYPVYKEGDTFIYSCGNKYDTFCYYSKTIYDHEYDKQYHYQEIYYIILNKNYPELNQPSPSSISLYSDYIEISWLNYYNRLNYNESPIIPILTINNITYNNVYELSNGSNDTNYLYVNKIYFNYKYWVIRYVKADSTTWDLVQH